MDQDPVQLEAKVKERDGSFTFVVPLYSLLLGLLLGFVGMLVAEWSNPATLGPMGLADKLLNSAFHSVTPRSGGYATFDVSLLSLPMIMVYLLLMWIGGSPGSTAGRTMTTLARSSPGPCASGR